MPRRLAHRARLSSDSDNIATFANTHKSPQYTPTTPSLPVPTPNTMTAIDAQLEQFGLSLNCIQCSSTDSGGFCLLPDIGFAAIDGPDALKFLQGQATCDSNNINRGNTSAGAFCNLKGRIYSSFHAALPADERLLLRMSRDLVTDTVATLGKYIVFSKAEIADTSDDYIGLGVFGADAGDAIEHLWGSRPAALNHAVSGDAGCAWQRDAAGEMFECWIATARAAQTIATLSEVLPPRAPADWYRGEIRLGMGRVVAATAGEFLPQMLNMQAIGAVSFSKGCYTGQEVVARMQYRGKVKRRMFRASAATTTPQAGDAILDGNGSACGHVVQAVQTAPGQTELLAVITISAVESATCAEGSPLTIEALPYPLED